MDKYHPYPQSPKMKVICFLLGVTGIITAVVSYMIAQKMFERIDRRDRDLAQWAAAYEKCVKVEYNTHPSAWYADHGEYPECDAKPYYDPPRN